MAHTRHRKQDDKIQFPIQIYRRLPRAQWQREYGI